MRYLLAPTQSKDRGEASEVPRMQTLQGPPCSGPDKYALFPALHPFYKTQPHVTDKKAEAWEGFSSVLNSSAVELGGKPKGLCP